MRRHPPLGRASIGAAVVLIAFGGVLAFAVDAPAIVNRYVDVLDLGLVLIWAGVLTLVMHAVLYRRPGPRRPRPARPDDAAEHDVHRPGYAGETRRFPTVRGR